MASRIQRLVFVIALLSSSTAGFCQNPSPDEAAIRSIVQSAADAWNRGDAEAFAARYADNGDFTNVIGQQLYGKEAFIAQHAKIFSTIYKGSHNELVVSKITFLRPDVALVDIDGILKGALHIPPGVKAFDDGAVHVKLLEVMTKEKGSWVIAAFHNVAVYPLPPGAPPK
jgi:uncharacterized protein (TIGR02246 family)